MCIICKKYGISEASYKAMVQNGVISTTFPGHEEIYVYYKECLKKHRLKLDAITQVCEDKSISQSTVYNIIAHFER